MEHEERELAGAAGAARSAQVLHVTPKIGGESSRLLQSALARARDAAASGVGLLVIVGDRQLAYDVAALSKSGEVSSIPIVPLTVSTRAIALLQRDPQAVVGTVPDLLALVRSASLKLTAVRQVVLLWLENVLDDEQHAAELETLLGETPREADRTIIAEQVTPKVEAFIERLGLKPRRLTHETVPITSARTINYVIVAAEQRAAMLQRLLDARDTTPVAVVAGDERAAQDAAATLAALGIDDPAIGRVLAEGETADAPLIVWYGPPTSSERIATLMAAPESSEIVLLASADELRRLRVLSAALTLTPLSFPQPASEGARRQRVIRDEITTVLRRESVDAELAAIEPLLAKHDAAEVAAAVLRLLGRARKAREEAEPEAAPRAPRPAPPTEQPWTRLFLSVGERDGARRGDLVGAITGEAEITGSQVGKIEMRDTYSLVDVASSVADRVVERLTGVSIRGRRVTARLDRGSSRSGPADARRPAARRDVGEGSDALHGAPRATREHEEWSARAERLRHARRPPGASTET